MTNSIKMSAAVVVAVLAVLDLGLAGQASAEEFQRSVRAFPYSTMYQGFRRPYENELQPFLPNLPSTPEQREIADLVDSIDSNYGRFRRNAAAPIYKRYACRFKFCRIFDA
uniref:Uncharacterized protein n=1 Tax=Panagrellus redivivus TaxID=6233 RepID=A0A7E4VH29_PANRE